MNLVSFALRRPISLLVIVLASALLGYLALDRMPRDIFPDLGVPVLYVAQPFGGMDPAQMEGFIVNYYEYHFLYITGIEHVESKSIQGVGLIKLQFHPGTNMAQATAETVAYVDRARAFMPTGTVPPFVMRFDGGSVPVGNLVFSSNSHYLCEFYVPEAFVSVRCSESTIWEREYSEVPITSVEGSHWIWPWQAVYEAPHSVSHTADVPLFRAFSAEGHFSVKDQRQSERSTIFA